MESRHQGRTGGCCEKSDVAYWRFAFYVKTSTMIPSSCDPRFVRLFLPLVFVAASTMGCEDSSRLSLSKVAIADEIVEMSCGQCQFAMNGDGCELAIRYQGNSYLVSGSDIDDFGDAHAENGLCNCIRNAKVTGAIENNGFRAARIILLDADANK